jgi:hypothetical protein
MVMILLATALSQPALTLDPDAALAVIQDRARSYEERPGCSVTVESTLRNGGDAETMELRWNHETEQWTWITRKPEGQSQAQDSGPNDHYADALQFALLDPRFETRDGDLLVFVQDELEPGSFDNDGQDMSKHVSARVMIDVSGNEPRLAGYSVRLKKPFRMKMVAKINDFSLETRLRDQPGYGPVAERIETAFDVRMMGRAQAADTTTQFKNYDCPAK